MPSADTTSFSWGPFKEVLDQQNYATLANQHYMAAQQAAQNSQYKAAGGMGAGPTPHPYPYSPATTSIVAGVAANYPIQSLDLCPRCQPIWMNRVMKLGFRFNDDKAQEDNSK